MQQPQGCERPGATQTVGVERRPSKDALVAGSPLLWAIDNATIVSPVTGRARFHPFRYQAEFLADRSRRRIVLKARQTGLSNTIAIEALYVALHQSDSTIIF